MSEKIKPADYQRVLSGWRDLNPRPLAPHASTLPDCATPRNKKFSEAGTDIFLVPELFQFRLKINCFFLRCKLPEEY